MGALGIERDISAVCEGYLGCGGYLSPKLCAARTRPVPNFDAKTWGSGEEKTDSSRHRHLAWLPSGIHCHGLSMSQIQDTRPSRLWSSEESGLCSQGQMPPWLRQLEAQPAAHSQSTSSVLILRKQGAWLQRSNSRPLFRAKPCDTPGRAYITSRGTRENVSSDYLTVLWRTCEGTASEFRLLDFFWAP